MYTTKHSNKNVEFSHDFLLPIKRNPLGNKSLLCTLPMTLELQRRIKYLENIYLKSQYSKNDVPENLYLNSS